MTVSGKNFAPDTVVAAAGALATNVEIQNTESLSFIAPPSASGLGTLTIANRGGIAQKSFNVTPAPLSALEPGFITTVVGGSTFTGDGGDAAQAEIRTPSSLAIAANDDLYIADSGHYSVRKVDAKTGIITTVAGNGRAPGAVQGTAVGVPAAATELTVKAIALDAAGNLIVAGGLGYDTFKVDPATGLIHLYGERSTDYLAADGAGNLFYKKARPFAESIFKRPADGSAIVTVAGGGTPTDGIGDNLQNTSFISTDANREARLCGYRCMDRHQRSL